MSTAALLGLCLLPVAHIQDASRLSIAVLAPQSQVSATRDLLGCANQEDLRRVAEANGYRIIGGPSPYQVVHEDFIENSQYALALDVVRCLKGFDPAKVVELEDFPADIRRRIEPLLRRWSGHELDSVPIRFSVEPFPNIGVEDSVVQGRLSPPALKDVLPSWNMPAMHPLSPGSAPKSAKSTLPNPDVEPSAKAERSLVDRSVVVFGNPQNDQMRVRWAQELWKSVGERIEAQRQEYLAEQRSESLRVLGSLGVLQGFVDGRANLMSVTPAMRRFVEQRLQALGVAVRPDLGLVLRGCELFIRFEVEPRTYTGLSLGGILGFDGGTPR